MQKVAKTENELAEAKANPVPIGFIYVQLPKEKAPTDIWSSLKWSDVSADYSGLFFRVAGGQASAFGQVQDDNAPRITSLDHAPNVSPDQEANSQSLSIGSCTKWTYTGSWKEDAKSHIYMKFCTSGGEVRPRNMATKVWRRIA